MNIIYDIVEQEVDLESFMQLDDNLIKELIPTIGVRIKFLNKFRAYIETQKSIAGCSDTSTVLSTSSASTVEIEQSTVGDYENQNNESPLKRASRYLNAFSGIENIKRACRESYNLDLRQYLKSKSGGRFILNTYDKERTLSRKARNALVDLLMKDMITEYNK